MMFSADLSWTEPGTEKVGDRKKRIAKEKERERSLSSATPSLSSKSSVSSIQGDRELWWTSSLRKAKAIKPALKTRPGTGGSSSRPRKVSISVPQKPEIETSEDVCEPKSQSGWTESNPLSPTIASSAPSEPPEYEVPELEGDWASKGTISTESRSSHERRLEQRCPSRANTIEGKGNELQRVGSRPSTSLARKASADWSLGHRRVFTPSPQRGLKEIIPYSIKVKGSVDLQQEAKSFQDSTTIIHEDQFLASDLSDSQMISWRAPTEWDIVLDKTDDTKEEKRLPPLPSPAEVKIVHSNTPQLSRFQRYIRRMESAGPKVILDRLKEEWSNPIDDEASDELVLEKELWLLTAFQLQNLSRYARFPKTNTNKILELYGNLAEVYQLSAMHPRQMVHYITTSPQKMASLPGNVSYLTVPQAGILPLPYGDCTFSHIRASTLPSLIPSSKLPHMFRECFRLLAPGGMLEIRIMDAAPVRKTAGPKMKAWIEDRLSENLERAFRCSKPYALVSGWLTDAGFDLPTVSPSDGEESVKLRCAFDEGSADVDTELSSLVGRALWKNIWGDFVDNVPDEARWWWEDQEVMRECLERQTVFECGAIFAFKG